MLMLRAKPPADWLEKIKANLPAVLVDHAHLERKAATTALCLEKYKDLYPHVEELNAIAIEELQHFQLVLNLLKARNIPFGHAFPSPWISGMMKSIRNGSRHQAIDHLICCSLIEGRSCEKFQILSQAGESLRDLYPDGAFDRRCRNGPAAGFLPRFGRGVGAEAELVSDSSLIAVLQDLFRERAHFRQT
jgi:tRNA 2-(methylsulfanyl)-N6-isopentenyladenosine37 hydroxylase